VSDKENLASAKPQRWRSP